MNANDQLKEYTCTENYYRYLLGILLTDGTKALCETFECFWFIDIVCSYQPELKGEDFQVWTLIKNEDGSGKVVCTDGNDRVLKSQTVPFIIFAADKATVWVEGSIVLLPSEH